ncbi:GH25 family lysozyme [Rudaeicoccus suwonensis]|uniref:lysozyme n=1 Tax=Rudaeicoccus suwonensis TaxID=657409 RepID=A0A561E3E8_9MICO|nr:GH25 family lysozyme [Rudaeicoccus suwonensis]TWE10120.1 GH25 family lysozyme M1 (1,4-beta-N-acetylmuramidase) [Rudaeicoccus suwonensis]
MLSKTVGVCAVAAALVCMPEIASAAPVKTTGGAASNASTRAIPTPTAKAAADGVKKGMGAPMNWMTGAARFSGQRAAATPAQNSSSSSIMTYGMDVSDYSGTVDWQAWANAGYRFAWIKATEGTYYTNPDFSSEYSDATSAGMIRGAYVFANPAYSSGTAQADYFIAHGGGWSADGKSLPGVLDAEYDPYSSNVCYGLSDSQMVAWIQAFNAEYKAREGVYPVIYTTTNWWTDCTGDSAAFSNSNAFWIADYNGSSTSGPTDGLPTGQSNWTFWQWGYQTSPEVDYDQYNGSPSSLKAFATSPPGLTPPPPAYTVGTHVKSAYQSWMGSPTGSERQVSAFGVTGYQQSFSGGVTLASSKYGTHVISGAIAAHWSVGADGWPIENAFDATGQTSAGTTATGPVQEFQQGSNRAMAFLPPGSSSPTWSSGAVWQYFQSNGGVSKMGWPVSAATSATAWGWTGSMQSFGPMDEVVSSPGGTELVRGGNAHSWTPAKYGWPIGVEVAATGDKMSGTTQQFIQGTSKVPAEAFYTAKYGTVWSNGYILRGFLLHGGVAGLGWPQKPMSMANTQGMVGYWQPFTGANSNVTNVALVYDKSGTFITDNAISAVWNPAIEGWPTNNARSVARPAPGMIEQFVRKSGYDYLFWNKSTGKTTLYAGIAPK